MHRFIFSVLVLLSSVALSQTSEGPIPPGVPVPPGDDDGLAPRGPGAAARELPEPVAGVGREVDPNQVLREDQILPELTGDELADLYRRFTGRRVTVSVAASTAEFRFIQKAPMTYGEAAQLLKKAALLEGFVFVPDANMKGHDVLVVATGGANPKGEGLEVIIDPADLPRDDRVVSYVMSLQFIKPEEIVRTFTTVVGQFGPYGSITPINNAGAVVITEKTSLIRRLIELKDEIDVSASVATRFIKVQFADVQELAETLNEILNGQQGDQRSAGVQRVQNNQPPTPPNVPPGTPAAAAAQAAAQAAGGGGSSSSAAEEVPLQIIPETRTNRIFAMGRPVDIVFLEGLVAEFDTPTDQRNYLRRKLKYVAVADFLNIAEPALARTFSGDAEETGGGGRSTGANFGGNNRNTSGRNNQTSQFGGNTQTGGRNNRGGIGGGGGGGVGAGSTLSDPNVNSAPEARLVGRTLLVADNITNSLLVQGPPASVEVVSNLLDEIDVKADQVMISAVFGQLSLGDEFSLGIDYLQGLTADDRFAGRGGSGGFGNALPLDGTPFDPGSLGSAPGLNLYGRIGDNFNVLVNALQADTSFKVISRPTIFTANNRRGTISAGQRIAIPTNSFQSGTTGGLSTNVDFQDVFLTLEVVPLVNSEEEVTMEISLVNEELGENRIIDDNLRVPDILSRQILTSVTVPDGSTIALGGLITSTLRDSVTGIPVLSEIPGLGRLFSTSTKVEDRQELMVFIQPRIITSADQLYDSQVDLDVRYDIADETRQLADGPNAVPERGQYVEPGDKGRGHYPVARPVEEPEDERSARRLLGRPGSSWKRR